MCSTGDIRLNTIEAFILLPKESEINIETTGGEDFIGRSPTWPMVPNRTAQITDIYEEELEDTPSTFSEDHVYEYSIQRTDDSMILGD